MDGSLIGALRVTLGIDTAVFEEGLGIAQKRLNAAGKRFQQVGQQMSDIGKTLSVAVTAPILAAGAAAIQGAQQQAQAMAQVNAALASMGDGVGRTADQLSKAADQMELNSLFDADVILSKVTANLLTFGNVAGKQFDRAQQAAIDMATRMGTDPQVAAIMLGKALNDPIKGITALSRVGVQLDADQQNMIRSMVAAGDTAGAQGVILSELERQYGGAGKAAADASPWRAAQVAMGQAGDTIGTILIPVIAKVAEWVKVAALAFTELSPGMQETIVTMAAVAAAIGPILLVIGPLVSGFGTFLKVAKLIGPVFTIASTAISLVGKSLLFLMANPFLAAAAIIIGGIYLAWQNWDKIKPIIDNLGKAISEWWNSNIKPTFDFVMEKVRQVADFFSDYFGAQIKTVIDGVTSLINGDFSGAWEAAKQFIFNAISAGLKILNTLAPGAVAAIKNLTSSFATWLGDLASRMIGYGKNVIQGLVRGIMAAPEAVWNALKSVVLRGVQNIREFLGIASPSRLFMEMGGFITDGLAIGIQNGSPDVEAAMGSLGDVVATGLQDITGSADVTVGTDTEGEGDTGDGPVPVPESAGSDLRENFKRTFTEGVKAALKGDLKGFFQKWFEDAGNSALDSILNQFADGLLQALGSVLGGSAGGAGGTGGGLGGILTTVFSSLFGGGGGGFSGLAHGGAVHANVPIIVGENRPEMFVPSTAGRIIPNLNELRGGRGSSGPAPYFDLRGAVVTADLLKQMNDISRSNVASGLSGYDRNVGSRVRDNMARKG